MTKSNGDIEFVTDSLPKELSSEVPYLPGKWSCRTSMYNSDAALAKKDYFYSSVTLQCLLKKKSKYKNYIKYKL